MPMYEYKCTRCGYEFEIERSISATSEVLCIKETCEAPALRHFRSAPALAGHAVPSRKRFYHMTGGKGIGKGK